MHCSLFVLYFFLPPSQIQCLAHRAGNLSLRLFKHVAVDVPRRGNGGVPERARHGDNIHALIHQQRRERVPERVDPMEWQAVFLAKFLEPRIMEFRKYLLFARPRQTKR